MLYPLSYGGGARRRISAFYQESWLFAGLALPEVIQRFTDDLRQLIRAERLADEAHNVFVIALIEVLRGVAACQEDAHLRVDLQKMLQGIVAGQPWHGQVQDEQAKVALSLLLDVGRFDAVLGPQDPVAVAFEDGAAERSDHWFIVGEQDRLMAAARRGANRSRRRSCSSGGTKTRQENVEARAAIDFAGKID